MKYLKLSLLMLFFYVISSCSLDQDLEQKSLTVEEQNQTQGIAIDSNDDANVITLEPIMISSRATVYFDRDAANVDLSNGGKYVELKVDIADIKNAGTDDSVYFYVDYVYRSPSNTYYESTVTIKHKLNNPDLDDNERNRSYYFTYFYNPHEFGLHSKITDQLSRARIGVNGGDGVKVNKVQMKEHAVGGQIRTSSISFSNWADGVTKRDWFGNVYSRKMGYSEWKNYTNIDLLEYYSED